MESIFGILLREMKKLKNNHLNVGKLGEDLACRFLEEKGFKIMKRNYSKKWGEIDIVARDGSLRSREGEASEAGATVIFIEVKAQKGTPRVTGFKPEDHFNSKKKRRMLRACHSYLLENNYQDDVDYRIDLAAVELNTETKIARIRYYKNAIV